MDNHLPSGLVSAMAEEVFDQVGHRLSTGAQVTWLLHHTRERDYDLMLERAGDPAEPGRMSYIWNLADWPGVVTGEQQLRTIELLAQLHHDGWIHLARGLLASAEVTEAAVTALLDQVGQHNLSLLKQVLADVVFSDTLPDRLKATALAGRGGNGSWGGNPRSRQLSQWEVVVAELQTDAVRAEQLRELVLACPVTMVVAAVPLAEDEAGARRHMARLLEALGAQRWPSTDHDYMQIRSCRDGYLLSLDPVPGWLVALEQRLALVHGPDDGQAACGALHRMLTGGIDDAAVVARLVESGQVGAEVVGLSVPLDDAVVEQLDEQARADLVRAVPDLLSARFLEGTEVAEQAARSMTTGRRLGRTLLAAGMPMGPNPDWMDAVQLCAAPTDHGEHLVDLLGIPRYAHAVGPLLEQRLGDDAAAWATLLSLLDDDFDGTLGELLDVVDQLGSDGHSRG